MQQRLRRARDGAGARRHFLFSSSFPLSPVSPLPPFCTSRGGVRSKSAKRKQERGELRLGALVNLREEARSMNRDRDRNRGVGVQYQDDEPGTATASFHDKI